jgi:hypothetical protein
MLAFILLKGSAIARIIPALSILSMTAETLSIGFEQKLASDLIFLVYSSSSYKFRILDYFIACLSRYFSTNYESQESSSQ